MLFILSLPNNFNGQSPHKNRQVWFVFWEFNASATARVIDQGSEMMMMKSDFCVEETGVPGGNHRPVALMNKKRFDPSCYTPSLVLGMPYGADSPTPCCWPRLGMSLGTPAFTGFRPTGSMHTRTFK